MTETRIKLDCEYDCTTPAQRINALADISLTMAKETDGHPASAVATLLYAALELLAQVRDPSGRAPSEMFRSVANELADYAAKQEAEWAREKAH